MSDILKIRRTNTTGVVPASGSLSEGELASNITDKKLWIGNIAGNPIELTDKMVWKNKWVDGTYQSNDVIRENEWTMVANKTTTDYPAPLPVGDPFYAYQGNNGIEYPINAKQIIFGNRYTSINTNKFLSFRIYTNIGYNYDVYIVEDPQGSKIIYPVINFTAENEGWAELNVNPLFILPGTEFDIVAIKDEKEPIVTTWQGNWNYTTPNNASTPNSGQISHANKLTNELRIHKTDNDGIDQSANLLSMSIGDKIKSPDIEWNIQNIIDRGVYISFEILPETQSSLDGVKIFTFETVTPAELKYISDDDYWLSSSIQGKGIFIADGNYNDIVEDDNAYGIDIKVQQLELSPDWEILAYSGIGSSNSGGESNITDLKFREPIFTGVHNGGELSKGTGNLDIHINAGSGFIIDSTSDPSNISHIDVSWDNIDFTITALSTTSYELHNIYIDSDSNLHTVAIQNESPENIYDYIRLGWIDINKNIIIGVNTAPNIVGQTSANISDLYHYLDDSSISKGLRVKPSSGLNIFVESGEIIVPGINWENNRKDHNRLQIDQSGDETNPITLNFFNKLGEIVLDPQTDLPKYYDDSNNDLHPLTGGESVIHYLYFSAAGYTIQLGQTAYTDFADAYRNLDEDKERFTFAPCANVKGRNILLAQIVISKLAENFVNKSLADIISLIDGETGNTISPVDLTLIPQYLLHTAAAEDLTAGDNLSMDVNGNLQKYPATGGEGQSQYTMDNVDINSAIFLNASNNQGIIVWRNNINTNIINFVTAQGNQDGSISYSPAGSLSLGNSIITLRLCKIDTTRAGLIWSDGGGTNLGVIQNNGISSAPTIGTTKGIGGVSIVYGVDVVWDYSKNYLIGVYSENGTIWNRYSSISGNNVDSPPYGGINMMSGTQVRCTTEGNNVIVTAINGTTSNWREAAWNKPWIGTGRYDDMTGTTTVQNCTNHCGLQVQTGTILAQFWYNNTLQTYQTSYSSGSSISTPVAYGSSIIGKSADLIKTDSGIGYSLVLKDNGVIEVYEGTLQGTYDHIYTSTVNIGTNVTNIQSLMFGSVFAVGVIGDYSWSNQVILIDSSVTRTDHFIAVSPYDILQGQHFNADIALPLITLPREYPPGTIYQYGPYKYQVITHNQAVIIIEATIMQTAAM